MVDLNDLVDEPGFIQPDIFSRRKQTNAERRSASEGSWQEIRNSLMDGYLQWQGDVFADEKCQFCSVCTAEIRCYTCGISTCPKCDHGIHRFNCLHSRAAKLPDGSMEDLLPCQTLDASGAVVDEDDAASADEPAEDLSVEEPTEDLSLEEPARRLLERRPAEDISNTSRKPAEDFSLDAPARRHLERRSAEDLLKTSRRYAEDRSKEEPVRRPLEKRPAEDLSKTSQRPAEDLPKEDPQKNTLEDLSGSSKSLHQVRGEVVASQIRVLSKSTLDLPIPTKRRKMKSARVETITKNLRSVPAAKEARATNEEEDFDYYIHNYINSKK